MATAVTPSSIEELLKIGGDKMLIILLGLVIGFVISYIYFTYSKIPPKKVFKKVDFKELLLALPNEMKRRGYKYIVIPDKMEQNIRGIVIHEDRNKWDKRNNIRRTRIRVMTLDRKKDWEWADFFDRSKGKLLDIIVSDGTVLVPLSIQPNKDDNPKNIAWHLEDPGFVDSVIRDAQEANVLRSKYDELKRMYNRLHDSYKRIMSNLESTSIKLRYMNVEYDMLNKAFVFLEAENKRLKEEIARLTDQLSVRTKEVEELKSILESDTIDILGLKKDRIQKAGEIETEKKKYTPPSIPPPPSKPEKEEEGMVE